jgi:hypothetical protein
VVISEPHVLSPPFSLAWPPLLRHISKPNPKALALHLLNPANASPPSLPFPSSLPLDSTTAVADMSAPPNPPRRLVLFEPLGSSPARLMLAPAGALLPQGVRPVIALAVVADNHRGGRAYNGHAGSATPTPTAGPLLGVGGRPSLVAAKANNSGRGRVYTECHALADAAGHGRTPGALGLRPLFGAPAGSISAVGGSSATGPRGVVVGALDLGLGRLSTECHNVAEEAGHGRTAGTLGLGLPPLLGAPARFLGGSTSGATGERLDLGDEGGEGHGEEDVYAVGLAGPGSALGPVLVDFPSSVPQALVAANHNGRRRLSMECHAVADAAGHGRTAGALGLRPLLGASARFLGGSISGATGLRGRVVIGALDLGDGDGEGEEDVTDELRYVHFFFRPLTPCFFVLIQSSSNAQNCVRELQVSGCSSPYSVHPPLDLSQESNQNCSSHRKRREHSD